MLAMFRSKMMNGSERCRHVAESEKYMGYADSWRTYSDMATELGELPNWLSTEVIRLRDREVVD